MSRLAACLFAAAVLLSVACGEEEKPAPTPPEQPVPAALVAVTITVTNNAPGPRVCHLNVTTEARTGTYLLDTLQAGESRTMRDVASAYVTPPGTFYVDMEAGCWREDVTPTVGDYLTVIRRLSESRAFTFSYMDDSAPERPSMSLSE